MKKGILFAFLLLLTGCTIDYNLEIDNNKIKEEIVGTISSDEYEIKEIDTDVNIFYEIVNYEQKSLLSGDDIYNKKIIKNDDGVDCNFKYTYKDNFGESRLLNTCFENVEFREDNEYYYASIGGDFYCLYSNKITINVKTDYAVLNNNANKVKDNVYTWIIDGNTADIQMVISKTLVNNSNANTQFKPNYFRIIGFIVLIVLSLITYILYKKKNGDKI